MMDSVIIPRKPVVCRYFAASGACFYGKDCQFLHSSVRTSISPTFPSSIHYPPLIRSSSRSAEADLKAESPPIIQPTYHRNVTTTQISLSTSVAGLTQSTQELSITSDPHAAGSSLFEENVCGTTYYFSPEENIEDEKEDQDVLKTSQSSSRRQSPPPQPPHVPTSHQHLAVYAGPPSYLQNSINQQRASFFMNEELRQDLIQRNSLAQACVDPSLFPELPQEVDHYHELVPLEAHTLNHAIKSHSYGLVTSTFKATHTKTGLKYCLKRIHGYRVTSVKCMAMVEMWRKVQQCHLVTLREVFTTKAFGDHSMIFAYDYYAGAETLMSKHLSSTTSSSTDPFSSDPSAPRPYSMQKNRMLQQQAGKGLLAESLLWSYIIELCSALRSVHSAGLAVRALDPSKVLITSRGRLRLCGGGIFDVLTYDTHATNAVGLVPHYQQEDLLALGKLILALACNSMLALQRDNVPTSMDIINKNYSADLRNLIVYLLSTSQTTRVKTIQEVMPMIGARFFSQLEAATLHADILEDQLSRELDNGRLFRLLGRLGSVVDRTELNLDSTWSETGDRYLLKLFRDYVLHPVTEDGRPWIDLAHVVACLNRLDAASHDKICLTSRDQQNVLVVSYAELHHCLESSFGELQQAALAAAPSISNSTEQH